MKVFNLQCEENHSFEGWFQSEDDFISQNDKGLLVCPICDNNSISRLPSAAHIQSNKTRKSNDYNINREVKKKLLEVAKQILKDSEDVGSKFAQEARRIHRKEAESRSIHGTATIEESNELREEGIDVLTLPIQQPRKKPTSLQ
tara:strand:- start:23 stop:454 length:432 start_codon:yes stop_codon:yes gene_type:complete